MNITRRKFSLLTLLTTLPFITKSTFAQKSPNPEPVETDFDDIPLVDPNVISIRDSVNRVILGLSSPDRALPIQPDDVRVPLPDPTEENLFDFLAGVKLALIRVGAAREAND